MEIAQSEMYESTLDESVMETLVRFCIYTSRIDARWKGNLRKAENCPFWQRFEPRDPETHR